VIKPEEWNVLTVESAVPHGAQVRKGDTLLSLETEKIDRVIADLRTELKLIEVAMRQARTSCGDGKDHAWIWTPAGAPPAWQMKIGSNFSTSNGRLP